MKNNKIENSKLKFFSIINKLKNKDYDEALKELNQLNENENDKEEIIKLKSFIHLQLKDWNKVIHYNEKLIEINENNFETYSAIGVANFNLGNLKKSIKFFENSINNNINFIQGYENLGIVLKRLGDFKKSTEYFSKALKINSNNLRIKQNLIDNFNYFDSKNIIDSELCKINSKILELGKLPININDNNELFRLFNKTEEYLSATDPIIYTETQIFRKNEKNLNCSRHLKIFNDFSVIPRYCFGCFKVQIQMKNVAELIKLYFLFNTLDLPNIRKCVVELRKNVNGNYKGYIFTSSISEAKKILENLKSNCDEKKLNYKKIEIKHGCTEYYEKFPEFKLIKKDECLNIYKENWSSIENKFDKENLILEQDKERRFSNTINAFNLSDYLVIKNWLSYAKIIGDKSYKYIFDKNLNNIFFKNILDQQINLRNKELL